MDGIVKLYQFGGVSLCAAVGLLFLVLCIAPIGIWATLARRNAIARKRLEVLRYQNELLKWMGSKGAPTGEVPTVGQPPA